MPKPSNLSSMSVDQLLKLRTEIEQVLTRRAARLRSVETCDDALLGLATPSDTHCALQEFDNALQPKRVSHDATQRA
jgi:hypothetical protein